MNKFVCLSFRGPLLTSSSAGGVASAINSITEKFYFPWVYCKREEQYRTNTNKFCYYHFPLPLNDVDWKYYYLDVCNSSLWPLFHQVHVKPVYQNKWWKAFKKVNRMLALKAIDVADTTNTTNSFFINDYQMILVGRYLRQLLGEAVTLIFFLHIPWPKRDHFLSCPWRKQLIESLLSCDIVAFQTMEDCMNFLETVKKLYSCLIQQSSVNEYLLEIRGRRIRMRCVPIGIDFQLFKQLADKVDVRKRNKALY